jgi:MFS family permease
VADGLGCPVSTVYAAFSISLIIAALTVPFAGGCVDRFGGKYVLVASNAWTALSLIFLSQAQGVVSLFFGWAFLGFAMGAGLYDIAFASVVRTHGKAAPPIIIGITLLAGFASTVGWPVSHYLLSNFGWRQALLAWASVHLFFALPLNLSLVLPIQPGSAKSSETEISSPKRRGKNIIAAMAALAVAFVFASFCTSAMAGHMPGILQLFGVGAAASVLAGMAFGPAQVTARLVYFFALQNLRPITVAMLAIGIMPLGSVSLILLGAGTSLLVGMTHGFGNGIMTIVKGTLPLSIFGEKGYGRRQGLLFLPAGIAQALAPFLFSICIDKLGNNALYVYILAAGAAAMFFLWLKKLAFSDS